MHNHKATLAEARGLVGVDPEHALRLVDRVLAADPDPALRAYALTTASSLHLELASISESVRAARDALEVAESAALDAAALNDAALALARALHESGNAAEAATVLAPRIEQSEGVALARLLAEQARAESALIDVATALETIERAVALVGPDDDTVLCRDVLPMRAVLRASVGDRDSALSDLDAALARPGGVRSAALLATRAHLLSSLGRPGDAYAAAAEAMRLIGARTGPPRRAHVLQELATVLVTAGCYDEALPLALAAAGVAQELRSGVREWAARYNVVLALFATDRPDAAVEHLERLEALAERIASPFHLAFSALQRAQLELARSDTAAALAALVPHEATLRESWGDLRLAWSLTAARIRAAEDDWPGVVEALGPPPVNEGGGVGNRSIAAWHDLAHRALSAIGRHAEAVEQLRLCRALEARLEAGSAAVRMAHLKVTLEVETARFEEQQRSTARITAIFENMPHVAMVIVDESGSIRRWNPAAAALFGRDERDVVGQRLDGLLTLPPAGPASDRQVEVEVSRPHGDTSRALGSHFEIEAETGSVRTVYMFVDLTERLAMHARLKLSEEKFASAFRASPDGVFVLDPAARAVVEANAAVSAITGWDRDELLRRTGFEFGILDSDTRDEMLAEVAASGASRRSELPCRRRNGEPVYLDMSLERLELDGRPHVMGVARDVTQSVRSRESLQRALAEVERLRMQLAAENAYLHEELRAEVHQWELVGESAVMDDLRRTLVRVARTDTTVLVVGETGTGKELVARAVHEASARNGRIMVKVNCAAISAGLVESELFGHERGAFTGADSAREGRFELADGSSLFLDEIGELSPGTQSKLLRVLQEQEFERVGSSVTRRVDVRVIAASNRDLAAEVRAGRFREDLYYRLNVFPIVVPPLRERGDDVVLLAEHFLRLAERRVGRRFHGFRPSALEELRAYDWPGNVRELGNLVDRAAILSDDDWVSGVVVGRPVGAARPRRAQTLVDAEREHVLATLEACGWRIEGDDGAAERLGVRPSTLRSRIRRLGVRRPDRTA